MVTRYINELVAKLKSSKERQAVNLAAPQTHYD